MVDESGGGGNGVATAGTALAIHNKETLMPKETCPVCGILITYKNLARHIKLRHRIKYKYCHRCRQLVPNNNFEEHKATCVPAPGAVTAPGGAEVSLDGEAVTSEVGEEEEEEADDEQAVDPTEFLEANATEYSSPEAAAAAKGGDARKSDEFRAATSKNKLHSLLGKAFKHPRRKCAICDYTVSYSNFKRHLRNAHPQHYSNQVRGLSKFRVRQSYATLCIHMSATNLKLCFRMKGSGGRFQEDHRLSESRCRRRRRNGRERPRLRRTPYGGRR